MKNTVNLRESRRLDMREQDKQLSGVSAVYDGDRAILRVGNPPSSYSGGGVKSLLSVGLIIYISLDSLKCSGRRAKNNLCHVPRGCRVHHTAVCCSHTIRMSLDFAPPGPQQRFDSLGWYRVGLPKISELNYKFSLIDQVQKVV